ncbi:hypothetical protein SERLA73DRAFT_138864, partial [Serpula lacrymans var. lacrymans S7.3]
QIFSPFELKTEKQLSCILSVDIKVTDASTARMSYSTDQRRSCCNTRSSSPHHLNRNQ